MKDLEKDASTVGTQFLSELDTLAEKVNGQIQQMADDLRDIKKSKGYPSRGTTEYLADYDFFTVAFLSHFMRRNTLMRTAISQGKLKKR